MDIIDRIIGKVIEHGQPLGPRGKCWVWQGGKSNSGYGVMKLFGKMASPHRVAWEWMYAQPIPQSLDIDHLCRNRLCCNPLHLEPVTRSVNNTRGLIGGKKRVDDRCSRGHLVKGQNAKKNGNNILCRICQNVSNKKYMRKIRGL